MINYKENKISNIDHNNENDLRLHKEGQQEKKEISVNKHTKIKGVEFFEEVYKDGDMIIILVKIIREDENIKTRSKGSKEKVGEAKKSK